MTRRRPRKPEPIIARLLRLGILSEVDADTGRWISWSDDFRAVVAGSESQAREAIHRVLATDDPPTVRAWLGAEAAKVRAERESSEGPLTRWPIDRPSALELYASLSLGPAEEFARRQLAVLDFLRQVGIVDAVEVDPMAASIRVGLSEPYRRLIEAGREPDREPGFDAAWDQGGPQAARTWLEDEARKLGWSGEPGKPQPPAASGRRARSVKDIGRVDYRGLRDLIHEVYGAKGQRFLDTPRRSLGGRTPREALRDGDIDAVWEVAIAGVLGDWR